MSNLSPEILKISRRSVGGQNSHIHILILCRLFHSGLSSQASLQNMYKPPLSFKKINDNCHQLLIEIIANYIMTPKSSIRLPYSADWAD